MTNTYEEKMGKLMAELKSLKNSIDAKNDEINSLKLIMAEKIYGIKTGMVVKNTVTGTEFLVSNIDLWVNEGHKVLDETKPTYVNNIVSDGIWSASGCSLKGYPRKKNGDFGNKETWIGMENSWEIMK